MSTDPFDLDRLLTRREGCPTELELDEWLAGELQGTDAAALQAHCDGCDECAAHVAAHRAGLASVPGLDPDAAFARILDEAAARAPARRAAAEPERPTLLARIRSLFNIPQLGWVAAAGAAAIALFMVRTRDGGPPEVGGGVRIKGTLALELARRAPGGTQVMVSGDTLRPDDEVRFLVTTPEAGRVTVVGVEADGTLYTAWPLPEHDADPVRPAGRSQALAGAVQLDGDPGRELLHLVLCPAEVEARCVSAGADAPPRCAAGCRSVAFELNKAAP